MRSSSPFLARSSSGFTLIELLIVCAVLAAISYVSWGAYADIGRRAEDELARTELMRLATALKRFHDDTGYWPGEGPFQPAQGCASSSVAASIAAIDPASFPGMSTASFADRERWFRSPANLSLLFDAPALCEDHRLAFLGQWDGQDGNARRGWHGPYLPLNLRHWVDMDQTLTDIPAISAGPAFMPHEASAGNTNSTNCAADLNACALIWKTLPSYIAGYQAERHQKSPHARPLLFLLDPPRVIYWGADGRLGGNSGGTPTSGNACLPNADDPDGADDLVICL